MNIKGKFKDLEIDEAILTKKKEQTHYKIEYVRKYVEKWIHVASNMKDTDNIVFIDCMCNAGVYYDGDLTTSMEVLKIFLDNAKKYPNKKFLLLLNDKYESSIENTKKIISYIVNNPDYKNINNVKYDATYLDVNVYLEMILLNNKYKMLSYKNTMKILYVDPYDIGTVKVKNVKLFVEKIYSELIYNISTFDYKLNSSQDKGRIKKALGTLYDSSKNLVENISNVFLSGTKLQYKFSYSFKNVKNSEVYQIIFLTPHIRGLELLKDTVWGVFGAESYYSTYNENVKSQNTEQLSLISIETLKKNSFVEEAKEMVLSNKNFIDKEITYIDIESFILENTILTKGMIISDIIKPLIADNKLKKQNKDIRKNNFKEGIYIISL